MNLSRDAMLALERHFVGALSAPARTWLEPVPVSQLAFAGSAVQSKAGGCAVDFGTVDSPGREQHFVRVINCGGGPVRVHIDDCPKWLVARWRDAGHDVVEIAAGATGETLELLAVH